MSQVTESTISTTAPWKATFPHDASVPFYFMPGNNDMGKYVFFGGLGVSPSFSKDARRFFEEHFGPLNQVVPISGHKSVLLNAPGLVEEDYRRHAHGKTYDQWTPLPGGPSRGPPREKGSIRAGAGYGYQVMLGKETTEFLLKECLAPLRGIQTRLSTALSSPSSGAPTEPAHMDAPCHLPNTLRICYPVYLSCLVVTSIVLLYLGISPSRHRRRLSTLSSVSVERGRPSSGSGSAIWSSLWSTWSSRKSRVKTSPTGSLPLSARIPSTKAIPSYRASLICTPQGSPLLSPITLFPPEDEAEAEDYMSPFHYTLRRDPHHHDRRTRNGWSNSWSFVFWGRRRRVTIGLSHWSKWRKQLGETQVSLKRRGLVWRFASDCVSVALPAVVAWSIIGWLLF
ncbi:hypothetical protein BU15DRAFT_67608 [Melanogaster broomeanus]|nr:hypothetical protein BU15DRAFT_67608 [Melanogaster broomeanus]